MPRSTSGAAARSASSRRRLRRVGIVTLPVLALATLSGPLAGAASAAGDARAVAPHAVSTAPIPPQIYVASLASGTSSQDQVSVFSTASPTGAKLATVTSGSNTVAEAVSPNGSTVYTVNNSDGTIVPIDTASHSAQTAIPIPLGSGLGNATDLQAIAVAPDGTTAYVVDGVAAGNTPDADANSVVEVALTGSARGSISGVIPVSGAQNLSAIALTPDMSEALVTDETGDSLIPIQLPNVTHQRPVVGSPIAVGQQPLAIAVTPDGSTALVTDYRDGSITTVDLGSNATQQVGLEPNVSKSTPQKAAPQAVAVNAAGTLAYVTDVANGVVVPVTLNAGSATPGTPIPLGTGGYASAGRSPLSIAFSPDGGSAYVADFTDDYGASGTDGEMSVINVKTGGVTGVDVPADPQAIVVTPDEAPTAAFAVTSAPAGLATHFDASASSALIPGPLTYTWTFGDGTAPQTIKAVAPSTVATPTIDHVYHLAGSYTATLSVSDADGASTKVVYTGQSVILNGGPAAGAVHTVTVVAGHSVTPPVAYVANATGDTVTPILAVPSLDTPGGGDTGATIAVGSHPVAVAIAPDGGTAYVLNYGDATITPIDTRTNSAPPVSSWITGLGSEPDAIAVTPDGATAYVANAGDGTVSVVDLGTRTVDPTTISLGGTPTGIAVSPDGATVYVTDITNTAGDGTLVPIDVASGTAGNPIPVGIHPVAVALTPDGTAAYVADQGSPTVAGTVVPVALTGAGAPIARTALALGATSTPSAVAISSNGKDAYVTDTQSGKVFDVAIAAGTVTSQASGGTTPDGIAVLPGGSALFVAQGGSTGTVTQLSAPNALASTPQSIPAGQGAQGIAITPDQAPVARLTVTPTAVAKQYALDASATTFPSATPAPAGSAASYTFSFGDGTPALTTATPTATHTYARGGSFTASVTVTDAVGTSTTVVSTGQTASLHGSPAASAAVPVAVAFSTPVVTGISPSSGPLAGGTPFTVSGSNLFGASAGVPPTVTVGGTPATGVTVSSDGTSLSATLPAATVAGSVDVLVANPQATSPVSVSDRYTYLPASPAPAGAPRVSGLTPSSGPVTGSTGVVITGTGLTGATTVRFGTVPATSIAVAPDGTSITVIAPPQAGAGTVDVVVTTPGGRSDVGTGSAFTYLPLPTPSNAPVVLSISPASGPQSGQASVTITGSHLSGATHVLFGSTPASSFSVASDTAITAVTSASAAAGTVDVTVETPQGASAVDPADGYTYLSSTTPPAGTPTPVITGLSTHAGSTLGGTTVVISGSELAGASAVFFGTAAVPAGGITVNGDGTAITVASPAGTVGTVDVQVVTASGGSSLPTPADAFVYEPAASFPPVVTAVSPAVGAAGSSVTITGHGLAGLSSVRFGATSVPPASFTVNSTGTTATAVAPTSPVAGGGPVDIVVGTPLGTSTPTPADVFDYLPAASPPAGTPTVSAVLPAAGPVAGGTGVLLTGTDLGGATAVDFATVPATAYEASADGTSIVAIAPAGTTAGTVPVTVVSPGGTSTPAAFTYEAAAATVGSAPEVDLVTPTAGSAGDETVTVRGSNLTGATSVRFGSVAGTAVTVAADGRSLTVTSPTGPVGPVDVTVTTPVATSTVNPGDVFAYPGAAVTAPPTVTGLTPPTGSANGGDTITVVGTGFAGASSVLFGTTPASHLTVASDGLSLTVVTPELSVGDVHVRVVTAAGESATSPQDVFTAQPTGPRGGGYVSVTPTRILDTRHLGGPVGAQGTRSLGVLNVGGVPATGVSAVVLHVTALQASAPTYVLAYPQGSTKPLASNINLLPKQTVSNLLVVAPGTDGDISLFNAVGTVQVLVDVQGYVTSSASTGGAFTAVTPTRLLDTRKAGGQVGPTATRPVQIEGVGPVPSSGVSAVVLNLTGTEATASTFLTAYADAAGATRPDVSDLNLLPGQTAANRVVVPVGSDGKIDVYNAKGSTSVVLDVAGWYAAPTTGRSSGGYTAIGPVRVLDTRVLSGGRQPVGPKSTYALQLGSLLPAGVTSVVLNLTATGGTATTFVTAYPDKTTKPGVSDVNATKGQTVPNLVVVKVGADGAIDLYNDSGATELVVDLQGYFQ